MEMKGSRTAPASIEATWAALNDPETLKACIPGCESIERVSDSEYQVAITARVGPVAAKFNGRILLADRVPPTSYRMSFEGQGGAAGFARGEARVALVAEGADTRIDYSASAQVGGKLAQIGSRLVDGAAAKVAEDFFACFVKRVGSTRADATTPAVPPDKPAVLPRSMWVRLALAGLILLAIAGYWIMHPA